ncbi:uncharacterized mitochondrial protein-like protein [Tanacetum coccineum]
MTGNIAYLLDFKEFDGGYVTFRGGAHGGRISGKGTLKTDSLDFEDLPDESQILLKIPRKDNMYSFDMKNIVPKESLTCLVAKATSDESMLWHRRLGSNTELLVLRGNIMLPELLKQMVFVAERRNGTLIEVAKTMLADSKLPTTFWAEAVSTACYVQNRVLVVKPHNKTHYELFRGFKPALSFMRPFGCHVTIFNTLENLGKFDDKSDEGFFVGYSFSSKDFRVYNTRTRRVEENLHIGYNSQLVGVEYARTQEELNAGTSNQKEEITQDCIVMPIWKDASYFDSPSKDVGNGEPKSAADDQKQVEDGPHNESDEKVNTASSYELDSPKDMFKLGASHTLETTHEELLQFKLQQVWKLVDLPNGMGPLEQKWFMLLNQGFKDPAFQTKFSRCMVKALYGLLKDQELYETLVYVDDIIFGSTNKEPCTAFEKLMKDKFQMSSIGELTLFIGLQVQQKEDGIFISQDKYVAEILKKFNYTDVKSASTPVDLEKPLVKDGDADDVDVHLYRSMIGSLMYLTTSRPDIMFAVCACARFQVTPKTSHLLAVKRIFRYLKGKPTLGLWYSRDSPFELVAYTDSDYAGATQDRKSTTGGCQFLGNRLISWQCKKQTVVATSTTKAEYMAAASCYGQVLWI